MVDVLIIGAGVAGLSSAFTLQRVFGLDKVVVVEASDYVGGRVRLNTTFVPGLLIDEGAEFIHGDCNEIIDLAKERGWTLRELFTWSHGDGGPSDEETTSGAVGYYVVGRGSRRRLLRFDDDDAEFQKLNEALWEVKDLPPDDPRTMEEYLRDRGVCEEMISLGDAGYGNTNAGTLRLLSARGMRRVDRLMSCDGQSDFRVDPSMEALVETLAGRTPIKLNWRVRSVSVHPSVSDRAVRVVSYTGEHIVARRVVVSVPVPIIVDGDISFSPPLSEERMRGARAITFAAGLKILMHFRQRVWPHDCMGCVCGDSFVPEFWINHTMGAGAAMTYAGDGTDRHNVIISTAEGPDYVVTGFMMAPRSSEALDSFAPSTVVMMFLCQLEAVFPGARRAFVKGLVADWRKHPYIRGSYSRPSTDDVWSRRALAEPHANTVFFAGECTAGAYEIDAPTALHGAIRTGERAAREVAESLGVPPRSKM